MDKLHIRTKFTPRWLGLGASGFLLTLFLLILCPVSSAPASAVPDGSVANQQSLNLSASIIPFVAISTATNQIDLNVDPTTIGGSFSTSSTNVTVSTNSREGYSLYLETAGSSNSLTPASNNNPSVINALTTNTTVEEFPSNSWGVAISGNGVEDTLYRPVPASATEAIISSDTSYQTDTYNLTFAVKAGMDLPTGTYSGAVLVSAVANPVAAANLTELIYMQDMTTEICDNSKLGATNTLIDMRDGNSYEVTKLKSYKKSQNNPSDENAGNCWMTQNLALDIPEDYAVKFTPANTDIPLEWNWPYFSKTTTTKTSVSANASPASTLVSSYNFGKWVLATPTTSSDCGNVANTVDNCTKVGLVNVGNSNKWQSTFKATEGSWTLSTGETINTYVSATCDEWSNSICQSGTYDPHYLIGNYYSWNAVSVGYTTSANVNFDALYSICPKGWRLPKTSSVLGADSYSFIDLLTPYGLQSKPGGETSQNSNELGYNIAKAPLSFVRGGWIYIKDATIRTLGLNGWYWSSWVGGHSVQAYRLTFNNQAVIPAEEDQRWVSQPVRCLAR